jgi:hypothetical protein
MRKQTRQYLDKRKPYSKVYTGLAVLFLVATCGLPCAEAQTPVLLSPDRMPSLVREYSQVLGDRLWKPGKERVIISGVFSDPSGDSPGQLTMQLPALCRIDRQGKPSIGFNGLDGWDGGSGSSASDDDLIESLSDDTVEGFLAAAQQGANTWLVGTHVRVHDSAEAGPQWVDIYGTLRPVAHKKKAEPRRKLYMFDPQTRLLARVAYRSASGVLVETLFQGWTMFQGQALPSVWKRKQGGQIVFSFQSNAATFASGSDTAPFGGQ